MAELSGYLIWDGEAREGLTHVQRPAVCRYY